MIAHIALPALLTLAASNLPAPGATPSDQSSLAGSAHIDWSQEFRGVSRPSEIRDLAFPIRGRIVEVMVEPGERVKPGQPLIRLEDDLERATLELARIRAEDRSEIHAAESRFAFRAEDFALTQESNAAGGAGLSDLRESKFLYEQAGFDLEIARRSHAEAVITLAREQARLDQLTIRSPLEAVVVDLMKQPGEGVDELTTVMTIVDVDTLMIEIGVPPIMAMHVEKDMYARIEWDDMQGTPTAYGTVSFRAPAGHAGVRSIPVRIVIPNTHKLPSGLHARVTLMGHERPPEIESTAESTTGSTTGAATEPADSASGPITLAPVTHTRPAER